MNSKLIRTAALIAVLNAVQCMHVWESLSETASGSDPLGILAALAGAAAHSPGQVPGFNPDDPDESVSQYVAAAEGGVVYLNDEVVFSIPPGSLREDVVISIEKLEAAPGGSTDGLQPAGLQYKFYPEGLVFDMERPAALTVYFDGADLANKNLDAGSLQAYYFDEGLNAYVNAANQVDVLNQKIQIRVEHFTPYVLVAQQQTILPGNPPPFAAMQNPVPNPGGGYAAGIRADASFYVRCTARDKDPASAGYGSGGIAGVKVQFQRLFPAPTGVWEDLSVPGNAGGWMTSENISDPTYLAAPPAYAEDSYGLLVPRSWWSAATIVRGAGADVQFRCVATDNLNASVTTTGPALDISRQFQPGTLAFTTPSAQPIASGFTRTVRVQATDNAAAVFPVIPDTLINSDPNTGVQRIEASNASIVFTAKKRGVTNLSAMMGVDFANLPMVVTNGSLKNIAIVQPDGAATPFPAGPLLVDGRSSGANCIQLDAVGFDNAVPADGNTVNVLPTWTVSDPAIGTVNSTGCLTTLNNAVIGDVIAQLGAHTATLTVNVRPRYQVTANITGLVGSTTLQNNAVDSVALAANGAYVFPTYLLSLASYDVRASVQPFMGACHGGSGVIGLADATVNVQCYQLMGGSVVGGPLTLPAQTLSVAGLGGTSGNTDNVGPLARFNTAGGMTTDGRNLYVVDQGNHTIRKIVIASGQTTLFAGQPGSAGAVDGVGSSARFNSPDHIATDGTNLYVADLNNHTIRKIDIATRTVTTFAGGSGLAGWNDAVGALARFNFPVGITTDGTYLYVVDQGNRVVRKIDLFTRNVTTIAGQPGQHGSLDGPGNLARFQFIHGITTDGTYLYIGGNTDLKVRRVTLATNAVDTLAGSGNLGVADNALGILADFRGPYNLTTDGTYLYVTDTDSIQSRIRRIDLLTPGNPVLTIMGGINGYVEGPAGVVRFNVPNAIVSDGVHLFVADQFNHVIRRLLP